MSRYLAIVAVPLLAFAPAFGQRLTSPVLGYVFDPQANAIRLVSGIPGAASLDRVLDAGVSLRSAFIHSRARLAVANTKDGGVAIVDWSGAVKVTPLESALGQDIQSAAFDRSGGRVAISDGRKIEVWSGLRGTPTKSRSLSAMDGVRALALSEDGSVIAALGSGNLAEVGDEIRVLAAGVDASALAWLPGGKDLVAVDLSSHALVMVSDALTAPATSGMATFDEVPGALALSADGAWAAVGLGDDIALISLRSGMSGGGPRRIACKCRLSGFDVLEGNLVLHAIQAGTGAALLLDGDAAEPMISVLSEFTVNALKGELQ